MIQWSVGQYSKFDFGLQEVCFAKSALQGGLALPVGLMLAAPKLFSIVFEKLLLQ